MLPRLQAVARLFLTQRFLSTWQRGILPSLLPSSNCCKVSVQLNINLGQEKFFLLS